MAEIKISMIKTQKGVPPAPLFTQSTNTQYVMGGIPLQKVCHQYATSVPPKIRSRFTKNRSRFTKNRSRFTKIRRHFRKIRSHFRNLRSLLIFLKRLLISVPSPGTFWKVAPQDRRHTNGIPTAHFSVRHAATNTHKYR
jgi:hypothetical protein